MPQVIPSSKYLETGHIFRIGKYLKAVKMNLLMKHTTEYRKSFITAIFFSTRISRELHYKRLRARAQDQRSTALANKLPLWKPTFREV